MVKNILACGAILLAGCFGNGNTTLFTNDGAWCWFQDPRAVYINGEHERTYAQWMTRDGRLQVGSFDHRSGEILIHTLKSDWDADDHNVGSFLVLADNRLMVFYARHNRTGLFCKTSRFPEDISQWEDEITVSNTDRITYSHPAYLSDEGNFYVFWRGPSWKPTFATSKDGKNWSNPQILVQESGREATAIRPYLKVVSDGKSAIHFAFTDGHPRNEPHNSVYYLKYEDSEFFSANGERIGRMDQLPVSHASADLVYDGKKTGIRAWVWDIALDDDGNPVIAYTRLPAETDHRYAYARWTGASWRDAEITPGGKWFPETPAGKDEFESHYSGGISLKQSDPSTAYVSLMRNGQFEIEKWTTPDQGRSWRHRAITKKSTRLNVRPVFPHGYNGEKDQLLWMTGPYIHYTDYGTGIRLFAED